MAKADQHRSTFLALSLLLERVFARANDESEREREILFLSFFLSVSTFLVVAGRQQLLLESRCCWMRVQDTTVSSVTQDEEKRREIERGEGEKEARRQHAWVYINAYTLHIKLQHWNIQCRLSFQRHIRSDPGHFLQC